LKYRIKEPFVFGKGIIIAKDDDIDKLDDKAKSRLAKAGLLIAEREKRSTKNITAEDIEVR
jgi:hypothetical protein